MPDTPLDPAVEVARLQERVGDLEYNLARRLEALEESTKALVQAWETASGMVKFVKVVAGLGTALVGLYVIVRTYFTGH